MTRTPPALNLVHESETQRQHVRVKVPGTLEIEAGTSRAQFQLVDLSAGGIGFEARNVRFRPGQRFSGRVHITIEPIAVAIPVRCSIRHHDAESGRTGAAFEELAPPEIATIRRVVTAYLSGELIGVGDVMHTLSRNNFTAPRGTNAAKQKRGFLESMRAGLVTMLVVCAGATALVYTVKKLNDKLFGTTSTIARVSGPSYEIAMPRDGVFRSLVPPDGVVKKGAPIGTFETSMLDLIRGQALQSGLTAKDLGSMLDRTIKGTITSPCDCRVQAMYAVDEQYVGKGQQLAELEPLEFTPYVVARFTYPQADRLAIGTPVELDISGDLQKRRGRVTQLRRGGGDEVLKDELVVIVEPEQPLSMALVSRPVKVSAVSGESVLDVGSMVSALGFSRAEAAQTRTPAERAPVATAAGEH